jgi:hypothetical protein
MKRRFRDKGTRPLLVLLAVLAASVQTVYAARVPTIIADKLWERSFENSFRYANPFNFDEVTLTVEFTSPSGVTHSVRAFHDGDGAGQQNGWIWKVRFIPDEDGVWRYDYEWSDGSGSGHGLLNVLPDRLAELKAASAGSGAETASARGEPFVHIPYYVAIEDYLTVDDPRMDSLLSFIKNDLGANGVAIILKNRVWNDCATTSLCSPAVDYPDVANWGRLDRFVQKLKDRELGLNVMFYADDSEAPAFAGMSQFERLLLPYAVSRLAHYEPLSFDSGIDILQYRDSDWSEWFAAQIREADPFDHPVGSRHDGSSLTFSCFSCNYDSLGDEHPDFATILSTVSASSRQVFYTDRWRLNYSRGDFDDDSLRKTMWHTAMAGGAGFIIGGPHNGLRVEDYAADIPVTVQYAAFGSFWNDPERDRSGAAACNEQVDSNACFGAVDNEYVVYLEDGGDVTVNLEDWTEVAEARWYDPRSGHYGDTVPVAVGGLVSFSAPDSSDWVLQILQPELPKLKPIITRVIGVIHTPPPRD